MIAEEDEVWKGEGGTASSLPRDTALPAGAQAHGAVMLRVEGEQCGESHIQDVQDPFVFEQHCSSFWPAFLLGIAALVRLTLKGGVQTQGSK